MTATEISEYAARFWEQGYLYLEQFFDDADMKVLHASILEHYGINPNYSHSDEFLSKAATEVIPWFPQQEGQTCFDALEADPYLRALSEAILGPKWRSLYCMTMFSKPGSRGQAWHQDCEPEDARQYNLNRLVYTHDINEETGGQVLLVPGSHKRGEITVGEVDETFEDQIELSPKRGALLLIHGHAWHRVRPANTHYRVSTNFRCMPAEVPESITDICVYRNMRYQFATASVIQDRMKG